MVDLIITITFFLVPVGILSFGSYLDGHLNAFIVSVVAIAGSQIKNRWLRLFALYVALWLFWTMVQHMVTSEIFTRIQTGEVVERDKLSAVWIMMAAVIYIGMANTTWKLKTFYKVMCVVSVAQMVIALFQMGGYRLDEMVLNAVVPALNGVPHSGALAPCEPTGTLFCPNFLVGFLSISLVFFLALGWWWFLIPMAVILYAADTTTAIVSAIAGLLVYYFPIGKFSSVSKFHIAGLVVLVLIPITYGFFLDCVPIQRAWVRIPAWGDAISRVFGSTGSALFGFGPSAKSPLLHPLHNEWIAALFKYGVVGFSLLCGYVITIGRENRVLLAAFAAAAVNCLGNPAMHLPPSAFLIIIIMGLIEREKQWQTIS